MFRNDPDIISSLMNHLRIIKEERLYKIIFDDIPIGYESIKRFVWEDISELFQAIRATSDNSIKAEMLQEFTSIFLEECERIVSKAT